MPRRLLLLASLFLLAAPAAAHAYTFAEWDATGGPAGIARSGDFTYFTLGGLHSVGRATLGGVQISPFAALNGTEPTTLIAGPAGTLLFTDAVTNKVGRVTPAAAGDTATEFSEPTADHPVDLALDTHGDIWVAVSNGDLDCVNPAGGAVEVYSSQLAHPVAIAAGGDGALWLADSNAGAIARVVPAADCLTAPAGVSFPVRPGEAHPVDIAAAQAGTHLFLAVDGALDEVTPHGAQAPDFAPVPLSPDSRPSTVHSDATGVWWVDQANRRVGKYAAGTATEWALPRGSGAPADFAIASDKSLWYVAPADGVIGRFSEETGVPGQDGA